MYIGFDMHTSMHAGMHGPMMVHNNIPVCFTDECRLAIAPAKAFTCVHSYAVALFRQKKWQSCRACNDEKAGTLCIIKVDHWYIGLFGVLLTQPLAAGAA